MNISHNTKPRNIDFRAALNKERRFLGYDIYKNRNPFTAARTYWRLLGGWSKDALELCWNHGYQKSQKEAQYILQRTRAKTEAMLDRASLSAMAAYRANPMTKDRHANGAAVLAVVSTYAHANGYCSASQLSIGNAVGISRQKVNQVWLPVLEAAGLVDHVGWDHRGEYWYKGRQRSKWCKVFSVSVTFSLPPFYWYSGGGDTIPQRPSRSVSVAVPMIRSRRIPIESWWDIERCIGSPAVMETIDCYLVGEEMSGKRLYRPALEGCAWSLLRDCPRVWLQFRRSS